MKVPSKATVYRWHNEFKRGRLTLGDEKRSGRPLTAVEEEDVLAVKNLIQDNRRVTYQAIQHVLLDCIGKPSQDREVFTRLGSLREKEDSFTLGATQPH